MRSLDQRVWIAQSDTNQAQGRLRERQGGGAAELPGVRLMASGIASPQWNNGDVSDAARVDLDAVRHWYAGRAGGAGLPWGLRVPAGMAFGHGTLIIRQRCMGLPARRFRPAAACSAARIRCAGPGDCEALARLDADNFGEHIDRMRRWIEPHLGAAGFAVAVAESADGLVGIGTAVRTDDRAGPCVGLFGIGVAEAWRRRGIATALTSRLIEQGIDGGARLFHLNPDADRAARIYARLGFVETAGLDVYVNA